MTAAAIFALLLTPAAASACSAGLISAGSGGPWIYASFGGQAQIHLLRPFLPLRLSVPL